MLDSSAVDTAGLRATAVVAAFARPALPPDEWLAGLAPHLTVDAALMYRTVDPTKVPAHEVTGPALVLDGSTGYLATVSVPTDAGTYEVLLQRQSDGSWLTEWVRKAES